MSKPSKGFAQPKPAKKSKSPAIEQPKNSSKQPPFLMKLIVDIGMITFGLFQLARIVLDKQLNSKSKKNSKKN
ncbi:MAG: hypothetical protein WCD18_23335 [Thermosynechococcaceae cyanobacterium]